MMMIPEIGHYALILSLMIALMQSVLPFVGVYKNDRYLMHIAHAAATVQMMLMMVSFLCLIMAFVMDDFTVKYVASHSNSLLPVGYKVAAVWGGHEGSVLLWAVLLSGWGFFVSLNSKSLPLTFSCRILAVMGMISVGFLLFLLLTSNPFDRLLPDFPIDGRDLNPLLQDIGLTMHPPTLYMGYVGFSVIFAFAITALLDGRLDTSWVRWIRPWIMVSWVFLTLGITMGSWWAYYELGWGGFWFWDPVENASFMPWLAGTALIHSLAAAEKRGVFKSWTLFLAITTFSLCLLGTFLVRSGVLTSVHAFASDPTRGIFILCFLFVVVGVSLTLFAVKGHRIKVYNQYELVSKESFLLINNILLTCAAGIVLLGTLYPLIVDVLGWGKLSVGPPYFNALFNPLMLILMLFMGVSGAMRWKRHENLKSMAPLLPIFLSCILASNVIVLFFTPAYQLWAMVTVAAALWVFVMTLYDIRMKIGRRSPTYFFRLSNSYHGMLLAHLGIAVCAIGVAMASLYNVEKDVRLGVGDSMTIGDYQFTFKSMSAIRGPNYDSKRGHFDVYYQQKKITELIPEKRMYINQTMPMTEAAIDPGLTRDVYIALGEPLPNNDWAVRIYIKLFVRWIWLGGLLIAMGGMLVVVDRRYRLFSKRKSSQMAIQSRSS